MKKNIVQSLIAAGVGLAIGLIVSFTRKLYWLDDAVSVLEALSDCFVAPGLLLILFGLLVICTNGGTFDMLGFGIRKAFSVFKRSPSERDRETFYEYRARKQENKRSFGYLFVVGGIFTAVGFLFYLLSVAIA